MIRNDSLYSRRDIMFEQRRLDRHPAPDESETSQPYETSEVPDPSREAELQLSEDMMALRNRAMLEQRDTTRRGERKIVYSPQGKDSVSTKKSPQTETTTTVSVKLQSSNTGKKESFTQQGDTSIYTYTENGKEYEEHSKNGELVKVITKVGGEVSEVEEFNGSERVVTLYENGKPLSKSIFDGNDNLVQCTTFDKNGNIEEKEDFEVPTNSTGYTDYNESSYDNSFNEFMYNDKGKLNPTFYYIKEEYKEKFPESEGYKVFEQGDFKNKTFVIHKDDEIYLAITQDYNHNLYYKYYNEDGSWTEIAFTNKKEFKGAIKHDGNNSTYLDIRGKEVCTINKNDYPNVKASYDSLGYISKIVAESKTQKTIYNKDGRIIEDHDKIKRTVTYYYENGNKEKVEDNINKTTTSYYENGNIKEILDEKNNSVTLYDNNGSKTSIEYKNYGIKMTYDKDGKVVNTEGDITTNVYQEIINEIYKTGILGLPSTADNLEFLIKNFIHEGNIEEFLEYYKNNNPDGQDFLEALAEEIGLGSGNIKELQNLIISLKNNSRKNLDNTKTGANNNFKDTPDWNNTPNYNNQSNNTIYDSTSMNHRRPSHNANSTPVMHIDLPEIEVVGKAGKDVSIIDGHSFKPMTDENGETYYQVYTPEGERYTISVNDFENIVKSNTNTDITTIIKEHSTSVENTQMEETDTTEKAKDPNSQPLVETKTSLAQSAPDPSTIKLPTNNGTWRDTFASTVIYLDNYQNYDGTIDTDSLINDWKRAGGEVYSYSGTAAQNAFKALQNGSWDSNKDYGYTEDWSWTGFDVMQLGGGWNDPWGTMSLYSFRGSGTGGGGRDMISMDADGVEYANPFDKVNTALMLNDVCR